MVLAGLALCDKVVDEYTLRRLLDIDIDAVEIQLENWDSFGMYFRQGMALPDFLDDRVLASQDTLLAQALMKIKSKRFKSFHGPTNLGNLSSLDEAVREQAMEVTLHSMDVAQALGTDIFVLHPCKFDWNYWERFRPKVNNYMEFRLRTEDVFIENLKRLCEYYSRKGFTFRVGIENLEFNQLPSTVDEIRRIIERSREVWNAGELGLVLDIQHLKHSKAILKENLPNPIGSVVSQEELARLERYAHTAVCREHDYSPPEGESMPVINGLFRSMIDDIILIHLGGNNHRHATHDPILYDLRTFNYDGGHYTAGVLNLRQVLDIVHNSGYNGAIILEVKSDQELIGRKFEECVKSFENVRDYLAYLEGGDAHSS